MFMSPRKKTRRLAAAGVIPLVIVLGLSSSVWAGLLMSGHDNRQAQGLTSYDYSDNGLTCAMPAGYQSTTLVGLVDKVTQDSRFLNAAGNSPYVFGNAENITGRSVTTGGTLLGGPTQNGSVIGGTTVSLPNVLEMVFYSYGSGTTCKDIGVSLDTTASVTAIVVQVPIESGVFDLTGATFSLNAADWG